MAQAPTSRPWEEALRRGRVAVALIRHGQTAWNCERRFLGTTDLPLDDEGQEQARVLGQQLAGAPWHALATSPLRRARETAAHLQGEPVVIHALGELRQGELEGLEPADAVARYPSFFDAFGVDPAGAVVPGGESLGACRDRALAALSNWVVTVPAGSLLAAVTHQMVIASVSCTIAGQPLTSWRRHRVPNAHVTMLSWGLEGWALESLEDD